MSTIGSMVVEIQGDERPLRRSIDNGLKLIRGFADSAAHEMARTVPAAKGKDVGVEFARGIIDGATRELRTNRAYLVEGLLGGQINLAQFKREGADAANAFNAALEAGMRGLRGMGFNPENNLKAFEILGRSMKMEGVKASSAFVEGIQGELEKQREAMARTMESNMARAMGSATRAVTPAARSTGDTIGRQIGLGFAASAIFNLESIVRAEGRAEKVATGVRQALQGVAVYAASSFGPQGLLIAGVAAGTAAIIDHFAETRKQLRETRETFEKEIARMIDVGDSVGMIAKIRDLEVGKPSAGMGAGGFFKGSIGDLQTRHNTLVDQMNASKNPALAIRLQKEIDGLRAQLAPLVAERDQLRNAVLNRPDALSDIRGLPAVQITGKGPNATAKDEKSAFRAMLDSARDLVTILGDMRAEHADTATVAGQLLTVYDGMVDRLARLKATNPWGDQARELRKMIADVKQNAEIIDIMRGTANGGRAIGHPLTLTPTVATPAGVRRTDAPDPLRIALQRLFDSITTVKPSPQGGMSMMDMIGAWGSRIGDTIGNTVSQSLTVALGPIALLGRILEPGLRALEPLINSLIAPLAAVVQVVAVGLEPVFKLLFPIVKGVAIVFSFLAEMTARLTAMLAQAIGGFVKGIGSLLRKIPGLGGLGKSVQRAGQSLLTFADGMKLSANQMKETRRNLQSMEFGDTIDSVNGLGAAADAAAGSLRNVPEIFKMSLQQMRAFGLSGTEAASPLPVASNSGGGGGVTIQNLNINGGQGKPREIAQAVVRELEVLSEAQYGTPNRWAEVTVR